MRPKEEFGKIAVLRSRPYGIITLAAEGATEALLGIESLRMVSRIPANVGTSKISLVHSLIRQGKRATVADFKPW